MNAKKTQLSIEFFILLGLAFIVAIAFQYVSLGELLNFQSKKESEAVADIAIKIQREMLIAASVEDGYRRSFDVPDRLGSLNYSIRIINLTLVVQSKKGFYVAPIPSIIGNFTKGTNNINKTSGVIYVN